MPSPHLKLGKLCSIIIFFFLRIKYLHKLLGIREHKWDTEMREQSSWSPGKKIWHVNLVNL